MRPHAIEPRWPRRAGGRAGRERRLRYGWACPSAGRYHPLENIDTPRGIEGASDAEAIQVWRDPSGSG